MIGRFCFMTRNAELLTDVAPNPMRFSSPKNRGVEGMGEVSDKPMPSKAVLPYHIFTDIDMPGAVWGKAVVSYETSLQETYNKMFNVMLDNLHSHGVARMILPEGAEIADYIPQNDSIYSLRIWAGYSANDVLAGDWEIEE